jgi:hypothetical protein
MVHRHPSGGRPGPPKGGPSPARGAPTSPSTHSQNRSGSAYGLDWPAGAGCGRTRRRRAYVPGGACAPSEPGQIAPEPAWQSVGVGLMPERFEQVPVLTPTITVGKLAQNDPVHEGQPGTRRRMTLPGLGPHMVPHLPALTHRRVPPPGAVRSDATSTHRTSNHRYRACLRGP